MGAILVIIQVQIFKEKSFPLTGFEPITLVVPTKPIYYQLSYPGLDPKLFLIYFHFKDATMILCAI